MKRLIMQSALDDKDSCFNAENCFDYDGKTYEWLSPETLKAHNEGLHVVEQLAPFVRYREVKAADDYDYVDIGPKYETPTQVQAMNAKLDGKRMVVLWMQDMRGDDRSDEKIYGMLKQAAELGTAGWNVAADTSDHNELAVSAVFGSYDHFDHESKEHAELINGAMEHFGAGAADELKQVLGKQ